MKKILYLGFMSCFLHLNTVRESKWGWSLLKHCSNWFPSLPLFLSACLPPSTSHTSSSHSTHCIQGIYITRCWSYHLSAWTPPVAPHCLPNTIQAPVPAPEAIQNQAPACVSTYIPRGSTLTHPPPHLVTPSTSCPSWSSSTFNLHCFFCPPWKTPSHALRSSGRPFATGFPAPTPLCPPSNSNYHCFSPELPEDIMHTWWGVRGKPVSQNTLGLFPSVP